MNGFDNIPLATQPENLSKILFKHQLASIYQMETLEREKHVQYEYSVKETRLGFNADITGYGKTLSMIGLIVRDKMEWDLDIPFVKEVVSTESGGLILNRKIERFDKISTTLILVPTSIISQWAKELAYTNLSFKVIDSKKDIDNLIVENYDVVIVSVSMFNNLAISYAKYAWKRFIFDEPGQVRVSGMKEIIAGFYWLVTATPEDINLQHRNCRGSFMKKIIGDEWCKIEEQFDGMILKNDLNFVHASFNAPPTYHYYHKCFHSVLKAVSGIVNNNIHTMIAADNIEGAIAALGGKKTGNIVELVKNDLIEKLTKIKEDITIFRDIKKDNKKLEISTIEEVRIKKQIDQIHERFDNMVKDICSICTEKLKAPIMEPYCQNLFCGKCLLTWLKQNDNCPLCRANINTSDLVYLTEKEERSNVVISKEKQNTPLEKVIEILNSKKEGKFIIFSSYNETFKPICRRLKECSITFVVVVGNRKNREKSIDSFKHGETQVIFLNSNCNGAGINLQEATDIILYHKMTETTENQIIGRANRIGRLECLNVHHLQVDI